LRGYGSLGDRDFERRLTPAVKAMVGGKAIGGRDVPSTKRSEQVDRAEKRELVASMNTVFSDANVVVVAHYEGLTVAEITDLRSKVRDAGATIKVSKNRLVKLALQGTDVEHLTDLFQGPTIVAFSDDPVAAPKAVAGFAKTNDKLVVLGGAMGATNLDADGVKALAELPSLDELRARLVGMISTPATRIAQVISAPAGQLARVVGAYAEKDEAA
jgi:large subunit ribosomal protein L10